MVPFPGFPALLLLVSMHLSLFLLSFRRTEPRTMPLSPIKSGVSSSTTSLRNSWDIGKRPALPQVVLPEDGQAAYMLFNLKVVLILAEVAVN